MFTVQWQADPASVVISHTSAHVGGGTLLRAQGFSRLETLAMRDVTACGAALGQLTTLKRLVLRDVTVELPGAPRRAEHDALVWHAGMEQPRGPPVGGTMHIRIELAAMTHHDGCIQYDPGTMTPGGMGGFRNGVYSKRAILVQP